MNIIIHILHSNLQSGHCIRFKRNDLTSMAARRLASMTSNFINADANSRASAVYLRPGKWSWRHCLVIAVGIKVAADEAVGDVLLV